MRSPAGLLQNLTIGLCLTLATACSQDPELAKQEFFESGNQYFDEERYDEAIIQYSNAIELDPRFGEARLRLADALARVGNIRGAVAQQIRAADLLPNHFDAQLVAASVLLARGQFEDAETLVRQALELEPENIDAQIVRECPTGSRKSAAMVNTSYPTFCISAMLSSSRSRCAFSIQRCS